MDAIKLENTIKEFESEVEKMKSVNALYEKIDGTYKQIEYDVDLYKKNNQEILNIKNKITKVLLNYEGFQKSIVDFNQDLKNNITKGIEALKLKNSECENNIAKGIETLKLENSEYNKNTIKNIVKLDFDYNNRITDLRKENRESYQELEKLLSSKLERIKSDIEVIIRDGNINIERAIGTQFDIKFIQFNELITKNFEIIENKINRIYMLSSGIIALIVIDIITNFMR